MMISGKDKGKTGLIERVFPVDNKLVVKGMAIAKKHVKPSKKNPQGGIIEINQKVSASKVMILCPACGKPTKVGFKISDAVKSRVCKKCGQSLESVK